MSSRLTGATPPTLGLPPEAQRRLEPSSLPPRQPENVLPTISGLSLPPFGLGGRGGRGGTPPRCFHPLSLTPTPQEVQAESWVPIGRHSGSFSHVCFQFPCQIPLSSSAYFPKPHPQDPQLFIPTVHFSIPNFPVVLRPRGNRARQLKSKFCPCCLLAVTPCSLKTR